MTRPIRVIHLITGLGSGGAEMMLCKLLSRMDASRFESTVVSLGDMGVVGDIIKSMGVPVICLNIKNYFGLFTGLAKLVGILKAQKPEILQTWLYHADLLGLLAGKIARITVIGWNVRCSDLEKNHIPLSTNWVRRLLAKLSATPSFIIINSEAGRREHNAIGYHPRQWVMIPNGFDTNKFRPDPDVRRNVRDQLGLSEATPLIGLVARYHPMKGHEIFLRAAREITGMHKSVRFVLVGFGVDDDNKPLKSRIHDLGLSEKIFLMGYREHVANILPALDIMCLTSLWGEGFPNVVGEAMACAVPCVATDVGDCAAIIGDAGIVVPVNDWQVVAAAWEKLLGMTDDERERLGRSGRVRIESHFSLKHVTEQYEQVYEDYARQ